MSSGSHLSKELLDLVKSIGESRSKQEEDKIISNEASLLKVKFTEKNLSEKKQKELLIRAIYVEMLGHDASFAHIYAVNLTQSKNLLVKRIGYLSASLFINQGSEMMILMISTMQKDLQSRNHLEILAALNCMGKLSNEHVIQAVQESVSRLLDHQHEMIRKKSVMVLNKFNKTVPIELIDQKMKKALCDKDPSVMACALNYFLDEIRKRPNDYKDLVNHFVVILKQIIDHRLPRDYDYHRIPAPWIQTKLLEILSHLGAEDETTSKQMYEIITTVIKRSDDSAINVGYALVYQCLRTITCIFPSQELLDLATTTISRFLSSNSKNLKYMGIMGLIQIVRIDPKYTLDYQSMVVDCLEDADDTLKIKTLDLLFKMTNTQNVEPIVEKLLTYLKDAPIESQTRKDLVIKINELTDKFAPNKKWYINTMNKLFEMGGDLVTQDLTDKFIQSISEYEKQENGDEFRNNTIKIYLKVLKKNPAIPESLMQVIAWIMGEYGPDMPDQDKIGQIIDEFCIQVYIGYENTKTIGLLISALAKLHIAQGFAENHKITSVMENFLDSKHTDVQQRAIEYKMLNMNQSNLPDMGRDLFRGVPINEAEVLNQGMDLDLKFLDYFVEEQKNAGKGDYDQTKTFLNSNAGAMVVSGGLNFKAYQQEQPSYPTINQPSGASFANHQANAAAANPNPSFNTPGTVSTNSANNLELKTTNTKSVWGAPGGAPAGGAPSDASITSHYNQGGNMNQKKALFPDAPSNPFAKAPKPADIKKEKLKNQLFQGMDASKKESDSDSDEKPKAIMPAEQPPAEMNLLDFDAAPTTAPAAPAGGGEVNLMDDLFSGGPSQPAAPQQSVNDQLNDILGGGNFSNQVPQQTSQPTFQPKFQGIAGFTTPQFGQTWSQLTVPGTEQKINLPTPAQISGAGAAPQQCEAYGAMLMQRVGIQKIEVINNEVIAAGQMASNPQQCALLHCRVTPQQLEFTIKSVSADLSNLIKTDIQAAFVQSAF